MKSSASRPPYRYRGYAGWRKTRRCWFHRSCHGEDRRARSRRRSAVHSDRLGPRADTRRAGEDGRTTDSPCSPRSMPSIGARSPRLPRSTRARESPLDQQITWWKRCFEWAAEGEANPTIEAAFRWIEDNRPTDGEPVVLNWGDAPHRNMIFPADLSVAAVLDWEMVSLASPSSTSAGRSSCSAITPRDRRAAAAGLPEPRNG